MVDSSHKLLKRFRLQFIVVNILFALAVLLVVFGAVVGISWKQHVDDVYDALDVRINMTGRMGVGMGMGGDFGAIVPNTVNIDAKNHEQGGGPAASEEGKAPDGQLGPHGFQREMSSDQFVATAVYFVAEDGSVVSGFNEALSIDDDMLSEALATALAADGADTPEGAKGHIRDLSLYYKVRYTHDDDYVVAFTSGKYIEQNMVNLAASLALLGLLALAAFTLLSLALSRWITRPVENAWNQQQQFIADASHELKTPLTVITANDSILLSQPEATIESQRQWIESTETEAHLMQELVNDMLYLAKSDASKQPLEYGEVNLSDLTTLQVLQFESVAFEKGVTIDSNVQQNVKLHGDQTRLQRLVAILLDNACKYVDDNGHIEASLRSTDKVCILQVRNTGPVVDPEDIPHLFDRFYRSDKARTRGAGGVGLGLSIAKSIVEDHKGSIRVASTAMHGTTFTVELPLNR